MWFKRLALHPFLKAHPPHRDVRPAPPELLAAYDGRLPASLLELWRRKGLGFYGERRIALIDPRTWQPVLDRWITSPPDQADRIPIALTPLGTLLYYRRLTATDEDVASVDPVSKDTSVLGWSLEACFNDFLCDTDSLDALVPPHILQAGRDTRGPLEAGEVYELDAQLLSMQMLRVQKVDALAMHRRLRDAVDPPEPRDQPPATVGDALPAALRARFADVPADDDPRVGLYLSSYIDWHRLLALRADGSYTLLFWKIHHQSFERLDVRLYEGEWHAKRSSLGDAWVQLDIELHGDSLGSDARDEALYVANTCGQTLLLRAESLEDLATAIAGHSVMGRSENFFVRVRLDDPWAPPDSDRPAPPLADLPAALRALIPDNPLMATIVQVDEPDRDTEDEDGDGTVMCTLDLGVADGLRKNMPLWSPADSGRGLVGWVWHMDPHACRMGVKYTRAPDGTIAHGPRVGDRLTTRKP